MINKSIYRFVLPFIIIGFASCDRTDEIPAPDDFEPIGTVITAPCIITNTNSHA